MMGKGSMGRLPLLNGAMRAWRAKDGVAALEFAVVAPVLLLFVAEAFSLGSLVWAKMQVENAARAGAIYASTRSVNATSIDGVVAGATRLGAAIKATPVATESCGCPDESQGVVAAACGSTCAGGANAGQYVTVFTQTTYSVPFPLPGLGTQVTLTGTSTTRTNR